MHLFIFCQVFLFLYISINYKICYTLLGDIMYLTEKNINKLYQEGFTADHPNHHSGIRSCLCAHDYHAARNLAVDCRYLDFNRYRRRNDLCYGRAGNQNNDYSEN